MVENTEYQAFRQKCLSSLRIGGRLQDFEVISQGLSQVPNVPVEAMPDFLSQDLELEEFHKLVQANMGYFYHHFCASVPFVLEELCRLGLAVTKFAEWHMQTHGGDYFPYYAACDADATLTRTIAKYSQGLVRTLTDSPNVGNQQEFYRLCNPNYSKFYFGYYFDMTPSSIAQNPDWAVYKDGFNFVNMSVVFQFYNVDRKTQIKYAKKLLKKNGLMLIIEKLKQPDQNEYRIREEIKDKCFKTRYFSDEIIELKKERFLKEAIKAGEIDFDTAVSAIKENFKFAYLIWNSTNFYEFIACDDREVLEKFISLLHGPYIPDEFCFDKNIMRMI